MKRFLLSAIVMAAMSSAAFAEPTKLSDAQLDSVSAGALTNFNVTNQNATAVAIAGPSINLCVHSTCNGQEAESTATAIAANVNVTRQRNVIRRNGNNNNNGH
jgi:hypothetical protein